MIEREKQTFDQGKHVRNSERSSKGARACAPAPSPSDEITVVDGIEAHIVRKRVKNVNLRIARDGSHVDVSAPSWVSDSEVEAFIRSKSAWIASRMAQAAQTPMARAAQATPRRSRCMARNGKRMCACARGRVGADHGREGGQARVSQHDEPLGQLPTGDRAHLHQCAVGALSAGMPGICGRPRAMSLAGARPRSKVPPAHGRVYARLEAAPREAALRGCPFQRASRHVRLCPRTREPLRPRRDVRDLPACVEMKHDKKARNTTKIVQRWKNDYSFLRLIAKRSIIPTQLLEVT